MNLKLYTDVYLLRSVHILRQRKINPVVRAQVFLREGPGFVSGIEEAFQIIRESSSLFNNQGRVLTLEEGSRFDSLETVLLIEGNAQDVIPLETVLLGIITARTTQHNDHHAVSLQSVTQRVKAIKALVGDRPLLYFGARHWHHTEDEAISKAAFLGGASAASTTIGSRSAGQKGAGTIPHSLENVFAWKYGEERAVVETTKAFDEVIEKSIPRIALVDYANKEIDDSLAVAKALGGRLYGVRIDTGGENLMQGASTAGPRKPNRYWYGKGVTISGVLAVRQALDKAGYGTIKIVLSSGFGELGKVKAFVEAEKTIGVRLFDALGVGGLFDARIATMDIVGVGEDFDHILPMAKKGRSFNPSPRLGLVR